MLGGIEFVDDTLGELLGDLLSVGCMLVVAELGAPLMTSVGSREL
jgi:hypothetical protein